MFFCSKDLNCRFMVDDEIRAVYRQLITAWNDRSATAFAECFTQHAICIGFDGSQMSGKDEIESSLATIFKDHPTARYVAIVREIKELADSVYLLHANVGMVPPGKLLVEPSRNAIQILIAQSVGDRAQILSFQNTPAQFHGRPELATKLTEELNNVIKEHLALKA
jgi:uncharacterized protein (TIGR02246 family)